MKVTAKAGRVQLDLTLLEADALLLLFKGLPDCSSEPEFYRALVGPFDDLDDCRTFARIARGIGDIPHAIRVGPAAS